jgi:predicted phage-related endonuclease
VTVAAVKEPRATRRKKVTEPVDRSRFLGGSDAAAVMGVSPWLTPVELWKLKTGRAQPRPITPARQRILERGKRLEPVVLEMVVDKLREQGIEVEIVAKNQRYTDPEHAFLSVEIDFELRLSGTVTINEQRWYLDHELVNGDCKTVHGFARRKWGEESTEDVPIEYAAQFMTGLMVAPGQRRLCLVAALIGLDDVAIYWVVRDEETIAAMRSKLVSFWVDCVQADRAPDPFKFSDIKELYPLDNGRTVEATPEVAAKVEQLRRLRIDIRMKKAEEEALALDVGEYLEAFSTLTVGARPVATFKAESRTTLDEDALRRQHPDICALFERTNTTRVLRMKQRGR